MYLYTKQNNQRLRSFYAKGMSSITVVRDWNLVSLAEMSTQNTYFKHFGQLVELALYKLC